MWYPLSRVVSKKLAVLETDEEKDRTSLKSLGELKGKGMDSDTEVHYIVKDALTLASVVGRKQVRALKGYKYI